MSSKYAKTIFSKLTPGTLPWITPQRILVKRWMQLPLLPLNTSQPTWVKKKALSKSCAFDPSLLQII